MGGESKEKDEAVNRTNVEIGMENSEENSMKYRIGVELGKVEGE
jgi:hypothetical protein